MGQMNLLSIVGNLLVLPIVPFVMIYGFASTYAYALLDRQRLLWIEKLLVQYIYKISEFLLGLLQISQMSESEKL